MPASCQVPLRHRNRSHPGSGAPKGKRNGNYRHGFYTAEAIAERRCAPVPASSMAKAVACDDNGVASFDPVRHHPTIDSNQRASVAMWLHGRESSYMPDMARKRAFRIGRSRTGLGLFATAPIKKGAFIVEYRGRKLTTEQAFQHDADQSNTEAAS
jgi:hypothetical protein